MPPAPKRQPPKSLSPYIVIIAIAAAVVFSFMRLPGGLILWAGFIAAAYFTVAPLLTGPKDANGYLTPLGGEARSLQRHRFWSELKWRLFTPSADWLPNTKRDLDNYRLSKRPQAELVKSLLEAKKVNSSLFFTVVDSVGMLLWLVVPARFTTYVAYGAAAATFALPTDGVHPSLVWLNAAAVLLLIVQVDVSYRRNVDQYDASPGVRISVTVERVVSGGTPELFKALGMCLAGAVIGGASAWALVLTNMDWLITPVWLFGAGIAVASAATFLHLWVRTEALTLWRQTMASRAVWAPRWQSLKISPIPYLVQHERVGTASTPVDTFEAPGGLGGAAGIIKMYQKVLPLMGSGVRVAMLTVPDEDADGQPIEGSKHPLRFRVVTWQQDTMPDITDPAVDQAELALMLETLVYIGADEAQQWQPIFQGLESITTSDSETAAWATYWTCLETSAGGPLGASAYNVGNGFGFEAFVDEQGNQAVMYVGAVKEPTTSLQDKTLLPRLDEIADTSRWGQRWTDLLKQGARPPVLQYPFKREAKFDSTTVIHCQPFLVKQGLDPFAFFHPDIKKGLATTLKAAPFVTVTGFVINSSRGGERHAQGFSILWSDKPIPTSPSNIQPTAHPDASKWALSGSINDAFDAAKLPRPEVIATSCLTKRDTFAHIWRIELRLYGGVTSSAVKLASEKIRQSMGCDWFRVTESVDGCTIYAGANPKSRDVSFANPVRSNRDVCIALDWEQAFIDAKVVSPADSSAPKLKKTSTLPKNDKVQVLEFTIPRGAHIGMVRENITKLTGATGNLFIEARNGDTPDTFKLLVSEDSPMPFPAPFQWDDLLVDKALPFATGVEGENIRYDWTEDAHLLVLGGSGSGKSAALQALLTGAILRGAEVYLADPSKLAADFRYAEPWMKAMTVDELDSSAMMTAVYAEVKRRRALNGKYGVAGYMDLPDDVRPKHIFVFIDEFTSLMMTDKPVKLTGNESETELREHAALEAVNEAKRNIGSKAGRLAREARSAGVTLVLATQTLKADTLASIPGGSSLKDNLSRLVLGKTSFGQLMSALKEPTEAPNLGDLIPRGRGIFESSSSKPQAIQAWYDTDHVQSMTDKLIEHVPVLDASEKLDLSQFIKDEPDAPVFGEIIDRDGDGIDDREEIIDLGVADLSLDFGIDFAAITDELDTAEAAVDDSEPSDDAEDAEELWTPHDSSRDVPGAVLFLDIDGTLSPTRRNGIWGDYRLESNPELQAVWKSDEMLRQLADLPTSMVWLSDWEADANASFAAALGRGDMEYIERRSSDTEEGWWKLGAFRRYLEAHPELTRVLWADDMLSEEDAIGVAHSELAADIAARHGVRLHLVAPDDGLSDEQLYEMFTFLVADDEPEQWEPTLEVETVTTATIAPDSVTSADLAPATVRREKVTFDPEQLTVTTPPAAAVAPALPRVEFDAPVTPVTPVVPALPVIDFGGQGAPAVPVLPLVSFDTPAAPAAPATPFTVTFD